MNTLIELLNYGQSYWLDNLTRKKISGGELKKRVINSGLRGITSNPSIFNKAISNSSEYDKQIKELVKKNSTLHEIYEALTVKDVQDACDILEPVYKKSNKTDGFVSLEVSPYLARDTEGTIREARRLFKLVNRFNCFIKIPGTKEGIPAIEQMIYEGVPINITLLFSVERYREIAACYCRAVQRRIEENKPVKDIASVASFFLSRIDVLVDSILSQYVNPASSTLPDTLMGKSGIASARLAYQLYMDLIASKEWNKIKEKGAHAQRLLWASTSTKNPLYGDLYYVESLIGEDTVNTLPDETIDALEDHGKLNKGTILQDMQEAKNIFNQLKKFGIDINAVTRQLENEGINKFKEAYDELISNLAKKRILFLGKTFSSQIIRPGQLKKELESAYSALDEKKVFRRLFDKDSHLWGNEEEKVQVVSNRLGWLTLPGNADELMEFAKQIKSEGFKHAVLLGMGGSSLCSEVARQTFPVRKGYPELIVLDNTAPDAIKNLAESIVLQKTIFIVASKSGSTLESISFFKFFYEELKKTGLKSAGNNFVAITDEGTPLLNMAKEYKFRKVFVNPSDIGGRYSVLSDFGLLPMALMGINIKTLLTNAQLMKNNCGPEIPAANNPGVSLGAALGIAQKNGRDKVTFVLSSSIAAFGYWVEQLLAESTGKQGKGLIPVIGEDIGASEVYEDDRIFVHIFLETEKNKSIENKLFLLEQKGHPVISIQLPDKTALGGEYYRWETATSIAGFIMRIDPFDEPNVAEGKKNTNDLLDGWEKNRSFKKPELYLEENDILVYVSKQAKGSLGNQKLSLTALVKKFYTLVQSKDYIAILNYFTETTKRKNILHAWRMTIRDHLKIATTMDYGPRYLHSTGQLHKGGPGTGMFFILASDTQDSLQIPGQQYTFGVLHEAQSWGDFTSLEDRGRYMIYLQLGKNVDKGLAYLKKILVK